MTQIAHPLKEGTRVKGSRPSCPCRGAKMIPFEGTIKKVIVNRSGTWYYVDVGVTVKADAVTEII